VKSTRNFDGSCTQRSFRGFDAMEKQAIIALAGAVVEKDSAKAREIDRRNALAYCLRIVLLEDGIEGDDVSDQQYVQGEKLIEQLRVKAAALVEANMPAIGRVAEALGERGELNQALMAADS
jgi:hypothetical protein